MYAVWLAAWDAGARESSPILNRAYLRLAALRQEQATLLASLGGASAAERIDRRDRIAGLDARIAELEALVRVPEPTRVEHETSSESNA